VLPSGTAKLGTNEYPIIVKATPETLEELAAFPIKSVEGRIVYLRDVANVRDGSMPQTSMVHVGGHRSILMVVMKNGDASTLDVTAGVRARLAGAMDRRRAASSASRSCSTSRSSCAPPSRASCTRPRSRAC
jgi:multidrug efflux pump subunit AcrB